MLCVDPNIAVAGSTDCLLNGLDDIGLTMEKMDTIRTFETERSKRFPWLDGATTRVPALWAVQESEMPADTPSHQLSESSPPPHLTLRQVLAWRPRGLAVLCCPFCCSRRTY